MLFSKVNDKMQKNEDGILSNMDLCTTEFMESRPFELTRYKASPFNQNFMEKGE